MSGIRYLDPRVTGDTETMDGTKRITVNWHYSLVVQVSQRE